MIQPPAQLYLEARSLYTVQIRSQPSAQFDHEVRSLLFRNALKPSALLFKKGGACSTDNMDMISTFTTI
jgi:hypothetical protein